MPRGISCKGDLVDCPIYLLYLFKVVYFIAAFAVMILLVVYNIFNVDHFIF
jgi:hypothetical protein